MVGSPPHTWRKPDKKPCTTRPLRITSTYVEKTLVMMTKAHPIWGSPPHTWRKHMMLNKWTIKTRITSTYVEKTLSTLIKNIWSRDHLHIRGENLSASSWITSDSGSPPHTWRKPLSLNSLILFFRITSTYVEKTNLNQKLDINKEDHLHIRGENRSELNG